MRQKISWFPLQCPNNLHASRLKLCAAIQFPSFACRGNRLVEMQHWTEVQFSNGVNVLGKGEWALKTTHSLIIPLQWFTTQAFIIATVLDEDWSVMVREIGDRNWNTTNYSSCILIEHLFKKKVVVWWVLHSLTVVQNKHVPKSHENI